MLIEKGYEGVIVLDPDGTLRYSSPARSRLLGYSGPPETPFERVHPDDRPLVDQLFADVASTIGAKVSAEFRCRHGDASWRWMDATATNLIDEPAVRGVVVNYRDVTERKLAEQELSRLHQHVAQQERLRALGEMASGVADDFNNSLSLILGFVELGLDELRPGNLERLRGARRYLMLIKETTAEASTIVSRLQHFYRPVAPASARRPVSLRDIVRRAVAATEPVWRTQALAEGRVISVQTALQPSPRVLGNRVALREAVDNLITNAVDALPRGGWIAIRVHPDGSSRTAERVVLEVADSGSGMTQETRERCLDPFFSTKSARGAGLGLSVVHGIVQRHGGSLHIESAAGRGTTVRLLLPSARHLSSRDGEREK